MASRLEFFRMCPDFAAQGQEEAMTAMSRYLASVLSIIAAGIILIAYGLLSPQASASNAYTPNGAYTVNGPNGLVTFAPAPATSVWQGGYVANQNPYAVAQPTYVGQPSAIPANIVRVADTAPEQPRVVTRTVVREPKRNWGKTAMVIGGSSAAGAGIGGIIGGKKGALIGAAIGGGASTLFESRR